MASGSSPYARVDLGDITPPGRQTDITWRAIREGVREIFYSDIDGNGTPAIVVLPHRVQATFVCRECMKSAVVKIYTEDAIRGHIALTRRCECGKSMYRRFLGPERDVPVEMDSETKRARGLEKFFDVVETDEDEIGPLDHEIV